jgi:hypothetical protein
VEYTKHGSEIDQSEASATDMARRESIKKISLKRRISDVRSIRILLGKRLLEERTDSKAETSSREIIQTGEARDTKPRGG